MNPEHSFYCVHTHYAFVIKFLAAELVSTHRRAIGDSFLQTTTTSNLLEQLHSLENGQLFAQVGIGNFLEGDFFGWFLDEWSQELQEAVWSILDRLSRYDTATLTLHPE